MSSKKQWDLGNGEEAALLLLGLGFPRVCKKKDGFEREGKKVRMRHQAKKQAALLALPLQKEQGQRNSTQRRRFSVKLWR